MVGGGRVSGRSRAFKKADHKTHQKDSNGPSIETCVGGGLGYKGAFARPALPAYAAGLKAVRPLASRRPTPPSSQLLL